MAEVSAAALIAAVQAVHAAALSHKRAEAAHRRQTRELMRERDDLIAECARLGIQIEFETTDKAP